MHFPVLSDHAARDAFPRRSSLSTCSESHSLPRRPPSRGTHDDHVPPHWSRDQFDFDHRGNQNEMEMVENHINGIILNDKTDCPQASYV